MMETLCVEEAHRLLFQALTGREAGQHPTEAAMHRYLMYFDCQVEAARQAFIADGGALFDKFEKEESLKLKDAAPTLSVMRDSMELPSGTNVVTPLGYATIRNFRREDMIYEVKYEWAVGFVHFKSVQTRSWVQVKLLSGTRPWIRFKLGIDDKLITAKKIIQEMRGIAPETQTLVYQQKQLLNDSMSLRDYRIQVPCNLLLVVSQPGFKWDAARCGPQLKLTDNNMTVTKMSSSDFHSVLGDKAFEHGRHYWEILIKKGTHFKLGVSRATVELNKAFCDSADGWGYYGEAGQLRHNSNSDGKLFGGRFASNDTIGVLLDMDQGTISFYKNREPLGVAYQQPELRKGPLFAAASCLNTNDALMLISPARIPV
eukprot:GILK01005901.1.p1 GENE.GILK01005901.1~~GILK01005901.1.p1  ORF type:complete len:372 (+),score=40.61 GILK01005901.1:41-1156(+)